MRKTLVVCLSVALPMVLDACSERASSIVSQDACSLLSQEDIASVQQVEVRETKSSERSDDLFRVAQCFYTTAEFSKSVTLALVQKKPDRQHQRSPKDFWKEKFGPYRGNENEPDEKSERKSPNENEGGAPPKKISDLGDDAYWVSNRFGGVLYVLKGDVFISIGLGGTDDEETKLKKSETLAKKAVQRL
jgi:hypothetical protein